MYFIRVCLLLTGIVLILGTTLFLVTIGAILVQEGVRRAAIGFQRVLVTWADHIHLLLERETRKWRTGPMREKLKG